MKIYNLGSLNIDYVYSVDHFVSAGETLSSDKMTVFPGGKGLNQSVALSRAGAKVIHGAIIGDNGDVLIRALSDSGVDTQRIKKINGSSGHAIIQVDKNGKNCILIFPGTNASVDETYIEQFLADSEKDDILLIQNEVSGLGTAFEIVHKKQMQIAFNPSPYDDDIKQLPLSFVKWWFCNEIEGKELFGCSKPEENADAFRCQFPESKLILTLGGGGSVFNDSDNYIKQSIYEVKPVDTTAGDTFTGYFIASVTRGKGAAIALDIASKAAALTVSRLGASSSIPLLDEVNTIPIQITKGIIL